MQTKLNGRSATYKPKRSSLFSTKFAQELFAFVCPSFDFLLAILPFKFLRLPSVVLLRKTGFLLVGFCNICDSTTAVVKASFRFPKDWSPDVLASTSNFRMLRVVLGNVSGASTACSIMLGFDGRSNKVLRPGKVLATFLAKVSYSQHALVNLSCHET